MGRQSRQARRSQQRRQAASSARHPNRSNINWSIAGPVAVVVVALVVFAIVLISRLTTTSNASSPNSPSGTNGTTGGPTVAGVQCGSLTMSPTYHVHAHLALFVKGKAVTTTTSDTGHYYNGDCMYYLHAHDTTGIIHIESPTAIYPTLGAWIGIDKVTLPPAGDSYTSLTPKPGEQRRVWLNGKRYSGDPLKIVLRSHEQIVVELGPPWVKPPKFTFPSGY